ncbi:MAG: hypothetical protein ABIV13_05175 [Fimbriimonadales bacterium]
MGYTLKSKENAVRIINLLVLWIAPLTITAQGYRYEVIDLTAKYGLNPIASFVDINNHGTMVGEDGEGRGIVIENGVLSVLERPKGALEYYAFAINDNGVILGQGRFGTGSTPQKSILWINGKAVVPDVSPAVGNLGQGPLNALNNKGIFGGYDAGTGLPILWSESKGVSYLNVPAGYRGGANGINDEGQLSGVLTDGIVQPRAFRWIGGAPENIHPAGYAQSRALAIAGNGDIGGYVTTSNAFHGGFWRGGTEFVDIGTLTPEDYTWFGDLNGQEQVVGQATVDGVFSAYFWERGTLHNLDALANPTASAHFVGASAINEFGQILAGGAYPSGAGAIFLLNPVPEPSGLVVLLAAVGATIWRGIKSPKARK